MIKVKSIAHLKKLATNSRGIRQDFFIAIAGGLARSSKQIHYDPITKRFSVVHEIDYSFEDGLTDRKLKEQTHIVDAIESGNFYKY